MNPYRTPCIHSWEPVADKFGYCAGWECKECHQILYGRQLIILPWYKRFCSRLGLFCQCEWDSCGCTECQEIFKASLWERKYCIYCKREADFRAKPDLYDDETYWKFKAATALCFALLQEPEIGDRHSIWAVKYKFDFIRTQDDPIIAGEMQIFSGVDEPSG